MDELLHERVKQLRDIDDRLSTMSLAERHNPDATRILKRITELRADLYLMIQEAERQHAEF